MTPDDLRTACQTLADCEIRGARLAAQLAELRDRHVVATDAVAATRPTLDDELAHDALGEPADVAGARAQHSAADDAIRGIERAIDIVKLRIAAHEKELETLQSNARAVMADLAAPLVEQYQTEVKHCAEALGYALETLMRADNCARLGGGFLSGTAAHDKLFGSPGTILFRHKMNCDQRSIFPMLVDRFDDLKPAQLLALLDQ